MANQIRFPSLLKLLVVVFLTIGAGQERNPRSQAVIYELSSDRTSYTELCFPPQICRAIPPPDASRISGTFVLTPLPHESTDLFDVFAIRHIKWLVEGPVFDGISIKGKGRYRLATNPPGHKLELDLVVGDRPVQHFDSGVIYPPASTFPDVEIETSMFGHSYFDTLMTISAGPLVGP